MRNYQQFNFCLPKGLMDDQGNLHRKGKIRTATGEDEILVAQDYRVIKEPSYSIFVMLSRLITNLGTLTQVTPPQLENLFLGDFYYLQKIHRQINVYPGGWWEGES